MKQLNLLVSFLIELWLLYMVGYWGFHVGSGSAIHWLLGIGMPLVVAAIWSVVAAPQSKRRLKPIPLLIFKTCLFILATVALYSVKQHTQAILFAAISLCSLALAFAWKQ